MVAPALVGVVVAVFLAERRWPAVRRPPLAPGHLVDAAYLVLFALVVAPLFMLVETGFAVIVDRYAPYLLVGKLSPVLQVLVVVVALVAMDAGNWLAHVANHRLASLWRLHALHHSQEDMSVFTTFRTHPLMHISYLPALIPVLILGAGGGVPGGALIAYSCLVTLPHANLRWSFGPVGRIVVSPAYHRLHHASIPLDERMAVNFGFVLVCWDRLAHQALFPAAGPPIPTGVAGRPVPIEQARSGLGVVGAFGAQLAQPFRWRPDAEGGS
jgi:sterol desaturase/sphingolipid hydroxylase (fatty acid hydroxylase superfamily)